MQIIYRGNENKNRFFHERKKHQYREKYFRETSANKGYLFRFLRFYPFVLFGWKENLYYEVNPRHLSSLRKEVEEKGKKGRRTIHATLDQWRYTCPVGRETFILAILFFSLVPILFFLLSFSFFFLSLSFFFFIFLQESTIPPSLINSFLLPRKNLYIYPRIACLTVSSPLSVHWSSHFSFVAWRKVHFSRVTCRQRYKGIFRASANIT